MRMIGAVTRPFLIIRTADRNKNTDGGKWVMGGIGKFQDKQKSLLKKIGKHDNRDILFFLHLKPFNSLTLKLNNHVKKIFI